MAQYDKHSENSYYLANHLLCLSSCLSQAFTLLLNPIINIILFLTIITHHVSCTHALLLR